MDEPSISTSLPAPPPEDRLDSWKEIAAYLKRDVTTVQRWEKREGMPVHRHLHDSIGSVYASRTELDAWTRTRNLRAGQENGSNASSATDPEQQLLQPPELRQGRRVSISASGTRWKLLLPVMVLAVVAATGVGLSLHRADYFWRNPVANARFQTITDFGGLEQAAAISRDGHFVAFLSDRSGQVDVWLTQVGSGEFHNLTHGTVSGLINPSIRNLGFSPDGSLVTFWLRREASGNADISVWAVPTLGGEPRPYLPGAAEFDWSSDGLRLAYHTPGPGDPLFVSDGSVRSDRKPIFTAPAGLHSHFPLWAPDAAYIYFVQGTLPDKLDIWRIRPAGGAAERITSHDGQVSHPVLLDRHTLLYLASDPDGSGPWLYSMDPEHGIPHRLTYSPDRYTSLAASADGHRLVATVAIPKKTLWRLPIDSLSTDSNAKASEASPISLTTSTGSSPRLGRDYLLYASATGTSESIWRLVNGASSELWRGDGAQIIGAPTISPDGHQVAFSIRQHGQSLLYKMQADGTNLRMVANSLDLQGAPAWSGDSQSILSAVSDHGVPQLFRIPLDGRPPTPLVREYSVDPEWSPDGRFIVYSGPDVGTTFSVKAVSGEGIPHSLPPLILTRGARHLAFLPGGHALVFLRGDMQHKDLWQIDLDTGAERRLTNLPADFDIRDFDISPDGREVVLERVQEISDVVLLDISR